MLCSCKEGQEMRDVGEIGKTIHWSSPPEPGATIGSSGVRNVHLYQCPNCLRVEMDG